MTDAPDTVVRDITKAKWDPKTATLDQCMAAMDILYSRHDIGHGRPLRELSFAPDFFDTKLSTAMKWDDAVKETNGAVEVKAGDPTSVEALLQLAGHIAEDEISRLSLSTRPRRENETTLTHPVNASFSVKLPVLAKAIASLASAKGKDYLERIGDVQAGSSQAASPA